MQGGDTMALLNSLWPFFLMGGIFYFMLWKPQKKEQQKRQDLLNSLKEGDEIITIGGIVGRVVTIREEDLVIETGADRNKMTIQRWAVNTNKTKMEQHRKEVEAAKEAAKKKKEEKAAGKGKDKKEDK